MGGTNAPSHPMTLKTRLRISILLLVIAVVLTQSLLTIHHAVAERFDDAGERASIFAQQVRAYILERVSEHLLRVRTSTSAQTKQQAYRIIRDDQVLKQILRRTFDGSGALAGIAILDEHGDVLVASGSAFDGKAVPRSIPLGQWQEQPLWARLDRVLRRDEFYAVNLAVMSAEQSQPVMRVAVLLSSTLLRQAAAPQLRELITLSGVLLVGSILLAIVVSNLVSNSIARLKRSVELASRGELQRLREERFESQEFADVHSRLERLGEQYQGARESVAKLRSGVDEMLERLEEAVLVFSADGRLQVASSQVERLLSRPRPELLGRQFEELFPLWGDMAAELKLRKEVRNRAIDLYRPNLDSLRLLVNCDPLRDGGMLMSMRDAETRRMLRAELNVASHLNALSKLTAGVAHEMRNPLNAVLLHLSVVEAQFSTLSNAEEWKVIQQELWRLDRVIKTFLDFNQPFELKMGPHDLRDISREVVTLMEVEARNRGVNLKIGEAAPAPVEADPELLKQAIVNVLSNSIEATQPGGEVRVDVRPNGGDCVVAIKDSGQGIPPEIRDKVFQLYFTTKQNGTGLGLAMAFRLVQLHGGLIDFETEPGHGSTFWIHLPVSHREALVH